MTTQFWQLPKPSERKSFVSLSLQSRPIPKLGPNEVLVKVKACSLNYRDLIISQGKYPLFMENSPLSPVSDGAGVILEVGSNVSDWKKDDRVMCIFHQGHLYGIVPTPKELRTGTGGGVVDGMLSEYRVLPSSSLVRIPDHLSYEEASTLPCAAVTAWNSLFGVQPLKPGQVVLAEGTGGVSVFSAQIAVHSGSHCVITSSSDEKLKKVEQAIPEHLRHLLNTVNYKKTPEWDKEVLKIYPDGADFIIEVGGAGTLERAFRAVKHGGVVADIGFVAQGVDIPNVPLLTILTGAIYRGIQVGSREQFRDMIKLFEAQQIKPVVDRVFDFKEAPQAFEYLTSAAHVGKVVIKL